MPASPPPPPNPSSPQPNGWIEDTNFAPCPGVCQFTSFTGTWTVPANPVNSDGQVDYLFTGLEDSLQQVIIQPVLTWGGPNTCGIGNPSWTITSYYVAGGACLVSSTIGANPGQTIAGSMTLQGCIRSDCTWGITTGISGGAQTSLTVHTYNMYYAYVAFETYGFISCLDYPNSVSADFNNLNLAGGTPGWNTEVRVHNCAENAVVNSQGNPSFVSLFFHVPPPPPCNPFCGPTP
jgi:hypothetical protein